MDQNSVPSESEDQRPIEPAAEPAPPPIEEPMETTPAESAPVETTTHPNIEDTGPTPAAAAPVHRNRARRVLGFLALLALFFLGGYLLAYFLKYQPAEAQRQQFEKNLSEQTTAYNQSQTDLQARQTEVASLQATLTANSAELGSSQLALALHTLQNDILLARLSLATNDLLTARNALRLADNDMKALRAASSDSGMVGDLEQQLNTAKEAMGANNQAGAEDALRSLSDNLNMIAGRLP